MHNIAIDRSRGRGGACLGVARGKICACVRFKEARVWAHGHIEGGRARIFFEVDW